MDKEIIDQLGESCFSGVVCDRRLHVSQVGIQIHCDISKTSNDFVLRSQVRECLTLTKSLASSSADIV